MDRKGKFFEPMAALVACGSTLKAAAEQCGCSQRQGYRLSGDPEFRQRVNELRTEIVNESIGLLAQASRTAVERLVILSECDDASVSLRACTAILDRFTSLSEAVDLRARVELLERNAKAS